MLASLPITAHHEPRPAGAELERMGRLAEELVREQPELELDGPLRELLPERIEAGPTLHLDDLGEIPLLDRFYDVAFLEDRARLRAEDGDIVASCAAADETYERYCEEQLGLGAVTWLHPRSEKDPLSVATACWTDRRVRRELVHALRTSRLRYVHPHMGNTAVWTVAGLLRGASRRPLEVIAPPPVLTRRVNDKIWFAGVVTRLFGEHHLPPTAHAWNLANLASLARSMSSASTTIVVKVPDSAGGCGTLVLESRLLRNRSLQTVRSLLEDALRPLCWKGEGPLLVGGWESGVLCSPSAQLWVPPAQEGAPVVEGLFEQIVAGPTASWIGSKPARLPASLTQEVVDRCWLLSTLFQRLGYVGRCSFDLLLVGSSLDSCRVELLECNGRWGGTSLPMSLMSRILGDHTARPYVTRQWTVPGIERLGLEDLLEHFADDLFDARTGRGSLIFYNPGGLKTRPGIDVLALGKTIEDAVRTVEVDVPQRLLELSRAQAHPC